MAAKEIRYDQKARESLLRGVNILKKALEEPMRWIAHNAGYDGSIVIEKVKNEKGNFGFDAQKEEHTDMVKTGIIDPTKVVRVLRCRMPLLCPLYCSPPRLW